MLTAEVIIRAYRDVMGYDAVAVSRSDLTAETILLKDAKKQNFPWVSANVFNTSGKLLFKPFIIKEINGLTVGIIGLTGPGKYENKKIKISGWKKPLGQQLRNLIPKTEMIILLSNFPSSQNDMMVKEYPVLNVIFNADKNRGNLAPYIIGNTLITQTQARGKYIGKLSI